MTALSIATLYKHLASYIFPTTGCLKLLLKIQITHWYRCCFCGLSIILITACSAAAPPLEFAPGGELIEKAIALQLNQTEAHLSQQLKANKPEFEISQIRVKTIDPVFLDALPSYHLQGTYNLKLKLLRQEVRQKNNHFDLYLQRQIEGKTWRLFRRQVNSTGESQWFSYLLE